MKKYILMFMFMVLCGCTKYTYPISIYYKARNYAHTYSLNYCISSGNDSQACEHYAYCVERRYIKESKFLEAEAQKKDPHDQNRWSAFNGLTSLFYPFLEPSLSPVEYIRGEPMRIHGEIIQSVRDSMEAQTFMRILYEYCGEKVFTVQERCESLAFTGVYPDWCPKESYEPRKKTPETE